MSNDGHPVHGPTAGLHLAAAGELSALERDRPELAPWLRPLGVALAALEREPWHSLAPVPAPARGPDAPLLHGATIPLDPGAAHTLVQAVLEAALGPEGREAAARLDAYSLLCAAVPQEYDVMEMLAASAGLDGARLAAAAHLAAVPLLQAARRALDERVPTGWTQRYCPVCGALPALVEERGLERRRTLRCGRCGTGWRTHVLLCAFCGESDHERLGSLVPEGREGQLHWIETCAGCHGYLKAFTTLRGAAPEAVPVQDAASLELDLAALERGFARPRRSGYPVRLRLVQPPGNGASP